VKSLQTDDDDGPSDGNSSSCLWQGELKNIPYSSDKSICMVKGDQLKANYYIPYSSDKSIFMVKGDQLKAN
jgi:hypothetical protein